jgi:hypothetical protein
MQKSKLISLETELFPYTKEKYSEVIKIIYSTMDTWVLTAL